METTHSVGQLVSYLLSILLDLIGPIRCQQPGVQIEFTEYSICTEVYALYGLVRLESACHSYWKFANKST